MLNLGHISISAPLIPPRSEFAARWQKLDQALQERSLDAILFFSARAMFYLTGAALSMTERPVALIHIPGYKNVLFIPRLELEHVQVTVKDCDFVYYKEYPDEIHPMYHLRDLLAELGLSHAVIAADSTGYSSPWGYQGPALADVCPDIRLTLLPRIVAELRMIKSPFEQMLMRESAKWSNYTHMLLREYTKPGLGEIEVCSRAAATACSAMLKAFGPHYRMTGMDRSGVSAVYRGQVGLNSYLPHAVTINAIFKQGDTLVTGVNSYIQGYFTEMERTMFVGEPSKRQLSYYDLAVLAQQTAFSMIRPGVRCCDVDREMRKFYHEQGLDECWRHHTGHAIGTEGHEVPFFDIGDDTVLRPGMCMTVEPGIYVEGLGGFRISDTLLITELGVEQLTYFSKEINELICG